MGEIRVFVVLFGVLALSCGRTTRDVDPEAAQDLRIGPDFREGTRLWLPHLETDDGFEHPDGTIYDSARGETCSFFATSDGKLRCMPNAGTGATFYGSYADANCSEPLLEWGLDADPPLYLSLTDGAECDPRYDFYETGPEFVERDAFTLLDGVCTPSPPNYRQAHYRLGPAVPLEDFVAGEDRIVPGRGRIAEIHRHADDGLMQRIGLFDSELGVECYPQIAEDGTTRCMPNSSYGSVNLFGSATCKERQLAQPLSCADPGAFIGESVAGECESRVRFRMLGPEYLGENLFEVSEGACVNAYPNYELRVEIGEIVPPDRFARLELDRSGTTRLRRPHYIDGQGVGIWANFPNVYDGVLDADCYFNVQMDDIYTCMPRLGSERFSDAACSQPIALAGRIGPCDLPPPDYVLVGETLHRRGARRDAPAELFIAARGACDEITSSLVWEGYDAYAVGPEVEAGLASARHTAY